MQLRSLHFTFFRSYDSLELTDCAEINCVSGENGEGKTNILDGIHYLSLTKGFRNSQDKHAIQEGEAYFMIKGEYQWENHPFEIQCNFLPSKGKKILLNQAPLDTLSEHIGKIPLVSILPEDTELINGTGSSRRNFIDTCISQYSHIYLLHLIQYKKIIAQRNMLLKQFYDNHYFDAAQLEVWDKYLIQSGQAIVQARYHFLAVFSPIFGTYFKEIVSEKEQAHIHYQTQFIDNTEEEWKLLLLQNHARDRATASTSVGTHKDDLTFSINGISAKSYGSQGQQKTFAIALKLAQQTLLYEEVGKHPILLLDDIFDKLDAYRLQSIANILKGDRCGQVFLTDTSHQRLLDIFADSTKSIAYFKVAKGKVLRL